MPLPGAPRNFCLECGGPRALVVSVLLAAVVTHDYFFDLSGYPRSLVVLGATLVLALAIWIGMKLLKVALWLLFFLVLAGGIAWAAWELMQ